MARDGVALVKKGLETLTAGGKTGKDFLIAAEGSGLVSVLLGENAARGVVGCHPEVFLDKVPCTMALCECRKHLGLSP